MTHYFGHNLHNLTQILGFPYEFYSENWQRVLEAFANIIWFHLALANTKQKHTFTQSVYIYRDLQCTLHVCMSIWCCICQHAFLRTESNWTDTSVLNAIRDQLYDTGSHLLCNWVGLIELNWSHIPLWGIASTTKCRSFELICTSKLKDYCRPIERNWLSAP